MTRVEENDKDEEVDWWMMPLVMHEEEVKDKMY